MNETSPRATGESQLGAHAVRAVPASREQLEALLSSESFFTEQFGLSLAPGFVQHEGALEYALDALRRGVDPRWSTHLFIHTEDRAVIGLGGFAGPPANDVAEIGYSIAPSYQGRGYATSVSRQLISAARSSGLTKVIAHTLASAGPSTRILEKLGFTRTGELVDPDDGAVWRWELPLAPEA